MEVSVGPFKVKQSSILEKFSQNQVHKDLFVCSINKSFQAFFTTKAKFYPKKDYKSYIKAKKISKLYNHVKARFFTISLRK